MLEISSLANENVYFPVKFLYFLYNEKHIGNHMTLTLKEAKRKLKEANKVAALTGAGISAESGIPVFRGKDGLWNTHEIERVATLPGFLADPDYGWKFHLDLMKSIHKARPSRAHHILAEMEKYFPEFHVITQNIDNLHQDAGNSDVIELHGNIWNVRCLDENRVFPVQKETLDDFQTRCDRCGGVLKPDVVFFGEALPGTALERALIVSEEADIMLVIGTSAVVQPSASMPYLTKQHGGQIFEFNPNPTVLSSSADFTLLENASKGLEMVWGED